MKKLLWIFVFLANSAFAKTLDPRLVWDCELDLGYPKQVCETPCDYSDTASECSCSISGAIDFGGGYRQDHLKWKTFSRFSPQTKIEEKWDRLSIGIIEANGSLLFCDRFLLLVDGDYGWVFNNGKHHFKNTDLTHDRIIQDLVANTKGQVWDASGGVGYQINFFCKQYFITPLAGYSYHQLRLKNNHFRDHLFNMTVFTHTNNRFSWKGPWAGFRLGHQNCQWQFYFDYRFHWVNYRAKVKEDLGIITQNQKMNHITGNEVIGGINYGSCDGFWTEWKIDVKFFNGKKHGHSNTANARASLRNLRWASFTLTWDFGYFF